MSNEEKIEAYERLMAILADRLALEQHFRAKDNDGDEAIQFIRADAYGDVVKRMMGCDCLPDPPL